MINNDIGMYIDISNLHEYMEYEIIPEQQKIIVYWNYENNYIHPRKFKTAQNMSVIF